MDPEMNDVEFPGLGCDCYGGCWGDHSSEWPMVLVPTVVGKALAHEVWARPDPIIPYGSHVIMGKEDDPLRELRLNSSERQRLVQRIVTRLYAEHIVRQELIAATNRFGPFASQHEGLAVVEEEFLELRDEAFWGHKRGLDAEDPEGDHYRRLEMEARQLAAMAIRFLMDITIPKLGVR